MKLVAPCAVCKRRAFFPMRVWKFIPCPDGGHMLHFVPSDEFEHYRCARRFVRAISGMKPRAH